MHLTLHLIGQHKAYRHHSTWPAIVTSLGAQAAPHCMQLTLHLAGQLIDRVVVGRPRCCSCQQQGRDRDVVGFHACLRILLLQLQGSHTTVCRAGCRIDKQSYS